MANLTEELVKQFAKITNDKTSKKAITTAYGVVKKDGEATYVQLDGSTALTPVFLSMGAEDGDRVVVEIQNHSATITGNLSSPALSGEQSENRISAIYTQSLEAVDAKIQNLGVEKLAASVAEIENLYAKKAEIDTLVADTATIKELEAENARIDKAVIDNLEAANAKFATIDAETARIDKAVIDNLDTTNARIETLDAETARIDKAVIANLEAANARFTTLEANNINTTNLTAEVAKLGYAQIDFSNVNNAWIENGVIKDGAIADAKIIGVSANKLTAGTIDASKITVTNLNADNLTVGTINGARIGKASIDLEKLSEEVPTKEYLDSIQEKLQGQIDGAIETWTSDAVPTLNNYPANDWKTAADRKKHVGDVLYVINAASSADGYCYRFAEGQNGVYSWVLIKDSDVTKALQDLITAQGDISGLKTFQTETSSWISETDDELSSVKTRTTTIETTYSTKTEAQGYASTAQTNAVSSAKTYTDTTTKDMATTSDVATAKTEAISSANTAAQGYASTAKSEAISAASADATSKANTAKSEAISSANATAKGYADTAESNAVSTASADATAKANGALESAKGYADGIQTALQTKIDKKVETSVFNEVKQTVDENSSTITTLTTTTETLRADLDGLEIGGRNLLVGSSKWTKQSPWICASATKDAPSNGVARIVDVEARIEAGQTYTLQAKTDGVWGNHITDGTGNGVTHMFLYFRTQSDIESGSLDKYTQPIAARLVKESFITPIETSSERGVWRLEIPSDSTFVSMTIRIDVHGDGVTLYPVKYWDLKLEKGNKPTDWTPAPEDIESSITTVSNVVNQVKQTADSNSASITGLTKTVGDNKTSIETRASKIEQDLSGFKSTVSDTYQTKDAMSGYSTTEQMNSAIQQSANTITSTVSSTYATKTEVPTKVSQLNNDRSFATTTQVGTAKSEAISAASSDATTKANNALSSAKSYTDSIEIGGRNLLLKTNQGKTNWSYGKQNGTVETTDHDVTGVRFNVIVASTGWQMVMYDIGSSQLKLLEANTPYVLSFDYKTDMAKNTFNATCNIMCSNATLSLTNSVHFQIIPDDKWHKAFINLETNALTNELSSQQIYISGFNKVGNLYIKNVKLEKGNKPTDWTPAPEDIEVSIETVSERVTSAETKIEQNESAIALRATKLDVSTAVNNLSIGGRNLLKGTNKTEVEYTYPSSGFNDTKSWVTTEKLNGTIYTLSFWAKSTVNGDKIRVHFYNPSNITSVIGSQGQSSTAGDGLCDFTLSTTMTKYWVTYTIPANGNSTRSVIIARMYALNAGAATGTGTVSIKWEKVEEGSKPTDWTPAPEDVEADATSKADNALTKAKEWVSQQAYLTVSSDKITAMVKATSDAQSSATTANNNIAKLSGDPTNYSQLNDSTCGTWGFTSDTTADGHWYTMNPLTRDKFISDWYDCYGEKDIKISFEISTSCKANTTNSTTTITKQYVGTAIGIYCYNDANTSVGIVYSTRTTGSAEAPVTKVESLVTTKKETRRFRVFVQTDAWNNFEGTIKIRNIRVSSVDASISSLETRVSTAEQQITADAIVSTVRSSTAYTNDLGAKVSANEIISKINQTAESITIDAAKINLNGYLTVTAANDAYASLESLNERSPMIIGTQTAGTYIWTGNAPFKELKDGQKITYWLPFSATGTQVTMPYWSNAAGTTQQGTNNGAALNLTLSDGTTTGNIACYYSGATRLTSHFPQGNAIELTYRKLAKIGNYYYTGWWANANYYVDTNNRIPYFTGKTGSKGIWQNSLFMEDANGTYQNICTASDGTVTTSNRTTATTKKANTNGFKIKSSIFYTNTSYNANSNISGSGNVYSAFGSLFDSRYSFNTSLVANSLTPYKPLYLVGTVKDDTLFYLDATWWTQTPTDTTKVYVLVGSCYDSTTSNCRVTLYEQNTWYMYTLNHGLVEYEVVNTENAAKTATNYMSFEKDVGLVIGDMRTGTLVGKNVLIDSDSVDIRNGSETLASFGANEISLAGGDYKFVNETVQVFDKEIQEFYDIQASSILATNQIAIISDNSRVYHDEDYIEKSYIVLSSQDQSDSGSTDINIVTTQTMPHGDSTYETSASIVLHTEPFWDWDSSITLNASRIDMNGPTTSLPFWNPIASTSLDSSYGPTVWCQDFPNSVSWYEGVSLAEQPGTYGFIQNFAKPGYTQYPDVHQIFLEQGNSNSLYHRWGNLNGWSGGDGNHSMWARILDSNNYSMAIKYHTHAVSATVSGTNANSVSVTAPDFPGFKFLCWLQVASTGHITWGYMEYPNAQSTVLYTETKSGSRNYICTALYVTESYYH